MPRPWIAVIMHMPKPSSRKNASLRASSSALLCALALAWLPAVAGGASVSLSHPTLASGGGVVAAGQFRIFFTMGEPAAGIASAGAFTVIGGLQATFVAQQQPLPDGGIFSDSFESLD